MVKAESFLALEASLSLRLGSTLDALTSRLYKQIQKAITASQWAVADRLMRILDLAEPVPKNEGELQGQKTRIAKRVSSHLGNTPKVALDSYIDPYCGSILGT